MAETQTTEVQVFAGGLNLVNAPHLLQKSESRYLQGVNTRRGNLAPFAQFEVEEDAPDSYAYYFNGQFNYYPTHRSNVLFSRHWYYSSVLGLGVTYTDGTSRALGIAPPQDTPIAVIENAVDGLRGNINYVYTYYDTKSGSESPPSKPSNTLDFIGVDDGKQAKITGMTSHPDFVTRLYRIGGYQTVYTLVDTLPIGDNNYTDKLGFAELQGVVLDTIRSFPPPQGTRYLTFHQGRFFGAVGSQLYFTPFGKPDSWFALDFISIDDTITGIVSVANGLIVMSAYKTWLLAGSSPQNFSLNLLSEDEGCASFTSIAVQNGSAIWLSFSGFNMSNGGSIQNLSINKLGLLSGFDPLSAVMVDKRYLMSFNTALYPSNSLVPSETLHPGDAVSESGIGLPKGALVIDFISGSIFSTIADASMGYLFEANSKLYNITNDPVNQKLLLTFGGSSLRPIECITQLYTDGSISLLKQYEKFRITYVGDGTVTVYDDSSRVFVEHELQADAKTVEWVYIPVTLN